MKKIFVCILLLNILIACTTQNKQDGQRQYEPKTYQKTINKVPNSVNQAFSSLEGCTKDFIFDILGLPSEKIIDNRKYYYWELSGNNTSFWTGNINSYKCAVHAQINEKGVVESVSYTTFGKGCNYIFANIVRYYTRHTQDEHNCPNRNDFYGRFTVTEEY